METIQVKYQAGSLCIFRLISIWRRYIKVGSGFHLELVHGGTGFGDVELVVVLAGHNDCLLFSNQRFVLGSLGIARIV